jgi:hypothetical protein
MKQICILLTQGVIGKQKCTVFGKHECTENGNNNAQLKTPSGMPEGI